ncbi:hypothetical protein PV10_06993 [Exophiala mesophila]|uniref:Peptidase M20 dimerisation domain-containing protein n=1 Tax=Exophiala mesophila TaxID=212818 RepID=A0A0D1Z4B3_EXOME|nr:uncharacterized protein PV10_06993 [Exophiala mesophila]KIV89607.1 hypothetical protein PV10_06993 [Exophiala mesophila]
MLPRTHSSFIGAVRSLHDPVRASLACTHFTRGSRLLDVQRRDQRFYATKKNSPLAEKLAVNADRLWNDIQETAKWSAPSDGGVTRLCADENDKMVRDWFKDQILSLGGSYKVWPIQIGRCYVYDILTRPKVNATGTQIAVFEGQDNSIPPIAMGSHLDTVVRGGKFDGILGVLGGLEVIRSMKELKIKPHAPVALCNWTNEEGARFFPPLGSSCVYAGQAKVEDAHASTSNDGSPETMGNALAKIGYIGDGPNTFKQFPISAHFELHVEQAVSLEKGGKAVGWATCWPGMTWYDIFFTGDDGHATTYPMYSRRDAVVGLGKLIAEIDKVAFEKNGYTTVTSLRSGPFGAGSIQSTSKVTFGIVHKEEKGLLEMADTILERAAAIAAAHGLEWSNDRIMHLLPGKFWQEAIDCVEAGCGDMGMETMTMTAHDSTMTQLLVPTAMVLARSKNGWSHCAKEWTSKEDCAVGTLVLGRAVLNFDEKLKGKSAANK